MFEKEIITLDFEGREVRLLVARREKVLRWASLSVPSELMDQGLIRDPQRMGASLYRFLKAHKALRGRVVTSVTGHRAVSRQFTLPPIRSGLLGDAIRRKAKQEMPLPLDETYLSWQVINRENEHLAVYALAVPRPVVDRHLESLRLAKIKPALMDLRPLALARTVHRDSAIILNLEQQAFGFIIMERGVPAILRSVPRSQKESKPKALIEALSQELARTVQFYNESHPQQPAGPQTPVYATGAIVDDPEMRRWLIESFPYPLAVPKPPIRWPKAFPLATYSANIGLVLKKA